MTAPPRGSTRTEISRGDAAYTVRFLFKTVFFELWTFFFRIIALVDVAGLEMQLYSNIYYCRGMAWIYYTDMWNSMVKLLERGKYNFSKLYG